MKAQLKGRLCLIEHCDFRCSEWTNLQRILRSHKLKLGKSDVVAMVSGNGKQIVFCYAHDSVGYTDGRGLARKTDVVQSLRYRITGGGSWDPIMLVNYAEAAGIELIGLKKFEQHYKEIQQRKRGGRVR
jgi:hypothetical protein